MPTVRTNGVETYYERRGDGPPVVFVHASIMDHAMWDAQVDALAGEYTTVAYDVRGHGRTGGSAEPSYSMELYAEDLRALLDELAVERPVLCGLSMGGAIAQTFAATHPDRVSGLVLADTFTPEILTRGEWVLWRLAMPAILPLVRLVGYERVEKLNVWVSERVAGGASGDYGNVEALREDGPGMSTTEFAKVIRSMAGFHEETVDLSAITVPTLVLYGENELGFVKRHAAKLAATLPDVEVDVVPDAGHASNLDDPAFFTAAVRQLLARAYGPDADAAEDVDGTADADGAGPDGTVDADGEPR